MDKKRASEGGRICEISGLIPLTKCRHDLFGDALHGFSHNFGFNRACANCAQHVSDARCLEFAQLFDALIGRTYYGHAKILQQSQVDAKFQKFAESTQFTKMFIAWIQLLQYRQRCFVQFVIKPGQGLFCQLSGALSHLAGTGRRRPCLSWAEFGLSMRPDNS